MNLKLLISLKLKLKKKVPLELLGKNKNGKIALRLPKSCFLIRMIRELAESLVSRLIDFNSSNEGLLLRQ